MAEDDDSSGWRYCRAKQILKKAMIDNPDLLDKDKFSIDEVYTMFASQSAFQKHDFDDRKKFYGRLNSLRKNIKEKFLRAECDAVAFCTFREKHPKPTHDDHSELIWDGSEAKKSLKNEPTENLTMKPMKLWVSKPEYQMFDLDKFRKHIYQEKYSRKKPNIKKKKN